jgi:putative transposase
MRTTSSPTAHQRHLRAGRASEPLACYAITKCVERRLPVLANDNSAAAIFTSLNWLREHDHIKLLAFCVMPDHYHCLFVLLANKSLKQTIESVSKFTATTINASMNRKGQLWQEGFHDHRCRDNDDVLDRLTYIEHNPVRADLVANAGDWPYSSAFAGNANCLDRDWYAERC